MATSRGITDTKVYDRRGRDRPLRHPARAGPRLHRPQGRHVGQHPRRPRHRRQDGGAAAAAVRRPRGRARARRRDLRRQAQGEPDRARRGRAHLQAAGDDGRATSPVDIDLDAPTSTREPDRSQPARGVPRVGAARPAAPPRGGARRAATSAEAPRAPRRDRRRRAREGRRRPTCAARRRARGAGARRARPRRPRASCSRASRRWRFAAYAGGDEVLAGEADAPGELVAALGDRPVVAHDAKALGDGRRARPRVRHRGRRLPARPARRGYPLDELAEERGLGGRRRRRRRPRRRGARPRARRAAARADRRARASSDLLREVELPLVARAARDGAGGIKLDTTRLAEIARARPRARPTELEREIWELARRGVHDRLAPAARRGAVRASSGSRASAAARPASRPTRACCRRSATSTRSSPRSSATAS